MGTSTSSGGTQTQQITPPAYQMPYLQEGLGAARGLFQEGGPQQYQGNTVVPFSPQSEQAMQGIEQRATQGSGVTNAAKNYVTNELMGGSLDQGNPYLANAVSKAGGAAYQDVTSRFARSGRNVNAAAPVVGDMLANISSQIYGGAYDADRNRQQAALAYASPLAEGDYRDLSALQGVGQQVEGKAGEVVGDNISRWNYDQQRPGNNLNDYLARISGGVGQTSTTQLPDVYRNRTAGGLGGGLAGGQLGSQLSGLFGENSGAWGAGLGALLGAFG